MNSNEFVIWLKGFVEACHEYAPTPKQWDQLKEKLDQVSNTKTTPIGVNGFGTTTTTGIPEEVALDYTIKQLLND